MPQSCGAEPTARRAAATSGWAPTWSAGVRRGAWGRGREGVPGPHVVAEPGAVPTSAWPQRQRAPRTDGQPGGSQDPLSARPRKDTPGLRRVALGPRPAWRPCVVRSSRHSKRRLEPHGEPCCGAGEPALLHFSPICDKMGVNWGRSGCHIRNLCSDNCPLLFMAETLPREGDRRARRWPPGPGRVWGRPGLPRGTSSPRCSCCRPDCHRAQWGSNEAQSRVATF